jgi:hypothetical protein
VATAAESRRTDDRRSTKPPRPVSGPPTSATAEALRTADPGLPGGFPNRSPSLGTRSTKVGRGHRKARILTPSFPFPSLEATEVKVRSRLGQADCTGIVLTLNEESGRCLVRNVSSPKDKLERRSFKPRAAAYRLTESTDPAPRAKTKPPLAFKTRGFGLSGRPPSFGLRRRGSGTNVLTQTFWRRASFPRRSLGVEWVLPKLLAGHHWLRLRTRFGAPVKNTRRCAVEP